MLPPVDDLKKAILDMEASADKVEGAKKFAAVIGKHMNKVQAFPFGKEGIFKFNETVFAQLLSKAPMTSDDSWIAIFASSWLAAVLAAQITPGTVTFPAWVFSGSKDVVTIPIGAVTVITAPIAAVLLAAGLKKAKPDDTAPLPIALAIHIASSAFIFLVIGLGPLGVPIPLPLPGL